MAGPYHTSRNDAERTIAMARVALGCASLFAVWLDPAEPVRYAELTYTLHAIYVVYAIGLAAFTWLRPLGDRFPLITHLVDIAAFSVFQFLTLGPSSPFFVYFIFSLFCGAMRWGWHATLWTASIVVAAYLMMTLSMAARITPVEFELNRAIIRTVYLLVSAALLVYLGRHEQRLRDEIERLARWPVTAGFQLERATHWTLEHAARIMGARRAIVVWEAGEEPVVHVATWLPLHTEVTTHPPAAADNLVNQALEEATFVCTTAVVEGAPLLVSTREGNLVESGRLTLPALLGPLKDAVGLASAPFRSERVNGRAFFGDLGLSGAEIVPLTAIVAREIGTFVEQLHVTEQLRDIAASEERIRVSRDLHDGVLQSLTGIRLEIRAVASSTDTVSGPIRDRLFAIERALAIEQRELRMFIEGLAPARPLAARATVNSVSAKLDALRERFALEWKTPVTIRVTAADNEVPAVFADAIPLMVHEAVVNALKHGEPSRVAVTVESDGRQIRVTVADDGQGFPFRGRYDHAALSSMQSGPKSLLERVTSLGGRLSIESTDAGSRVEMTLFGV
jgi:signal transduction histidine kinase